MKIWHAGVLLAALGLTGCSTTHCESLAPALQPVSMVEKGPAPAPPPKPAAAAPRPAPPKPAPAPPKPAAPQPPPPPRMIKPPAMQPPPMIVNHNYGSYSHGPTVVHDPGIWPYLYMMEAMEPHHVTTTTTQECQ